MPPSSKSRQRLQRRPSRPTCAKITISGSAAPLNSRSEYLPMPTASTTRAEEFREQLARRAMVADGAMGTMLYSRGVFINRCFDELNLSTPDMIRQIHQEYVKAGAEILETLQRGGRGRAGILGNPPVRAPPAGGGGFGKGRERGPPKTGGGGGRPG